MPWRRGAGGPSGVSMTGAAGDTLGARPSRLEARHLTQRDPFIDVVRVACICIVVLAHWMTTTVLWIDGGVDAVNALEVIPAARVSTWLLQVMPLVFFIGGFANAVNLSRHGGGYLPYLEARLGRLLRPTYVFLGIWLAVGSVIEVWDPNADDWANSYRYTFSHCRIPRLRA